jgi:phenylacetate-CoA ligase
VQRLFFPCPIGGIFTYKNLNKLAQKGYKLTIVPVGTNKDLFLTSCKKFFPLYDQSIIMGYPPFIKDVIDSGGDHGIDWKKYDLRILTAAEGYSESFREYLVEKTGIKNKYAHIVNIYGTVEQGTIAHETSFTALIRSLANKNKKLFQILFPNAISMPTVAQYYPHLAYFEAIDGEVVVTSYGSAIPLVRYAFSDLGGVISFHEVVEKCKMAGLDILQEAKKVGILKQILHLPIVYLFARNDFVIVFRGANIYPGEIRTALDRKELSKFITGKTTIFKKENKLLNPVLEINVELKKNVLMTSGLKKQITNYIVEELRAHNSEYAYLYSLEGEKVCPKVVGWPYHHPKYFSGAGKQQWVKK